MNGILNFYKPQGYTSHDAVARAKRFFGTRRVGHAGTLDPMATGVLPILVGSAAAAQDYLMNHDKTYIAGMRFGVVTDSGDVTGKVLSEKTVSLTKEAVEEALTHFVGKQMQVPPMVSAIKIGGRKLYDLAREGIEVERQARPIEIYRNTLIKQENERDFFVEVACSKGTYIRTLCEDIGAYLGCGGTLYSLERTSCGAFDKSQSVTLEEIEKAYNDGDTAALESFLMPAEAVFTANRVIRLSPFYSRLCKNGCEIYLKKAGLDPEDFSEGELVRLYDETDTFFALGTCGDFPQGRAVKATTRF